jgi:hypothetical protein
VVLCHRSENPFQDFIFQFAVNRPPRPDERKRCLDTPSFFFFEKAGGEMVVLSCNYLLEQKVAKKSSRAEAVSGISHPAWYLFHF